MCFVEGTRKYQKSQIQSNSFFVVIFLWLKKLVNIMFTSPPPYFEINYKNGVIFRVFKAPQVWTPPGYGAHSRQIRISPPPLQILIFNLDMCSLDTLI